MRTTLETHSAPMRVLALILPTMAVSLVAPAPAWAAGGLHVRVQVKADNRAVVAGAAALGAVLILSQPRDAGRTGPSAPEEGFVIIDATPPEAQVFLDGRALGQARQLVARAFRVALGKHTVEVVAPGFRPHRAQFAVDLIDFCINNGRTQETLLCCGACDHREPPSSWNGGADRPFGC